MCGELDFNQSFTERLSLLKDLDSAVINDIAADLPFSEGGKELMLTLKARGIKTVILSGGFRVFAERVAAELSMDDVYANTLDVEAGVLTGRVVAPIVNAEFKATTLKALARTMGIGLNQTLAVGDGANDLKMLSAAGIGIAFRAKPLVRAQARYQLSHVGLDGVLYLMGSKGSKP
jgi:phosphoserine phosphatase